MKRALYVSAFVPNEHAPHAGGQAAFRNRQGLEQASYIVTTLVCTTESLLTPIAQGQLVFRQSKLSWVLGCLRNLLKGRWRGAGAWLLLDTRANITFERMLTRELRTGSYDLVFADFTQAMLPVLRAVESFEGTRPIVHGCVHDVYAQKLLRERSWTARIFLGSVVRAERFVLQSLDEVVTLSVKDQTLVRLLFDCPNIKTKAWQAPSWTATVQRTPTRVRQYELLFFANFGRSENQEAVFWFLDNAWPVIQRQIPQASLVLAGAASETLTLRAGVVGVRCVGYVENPGEVFASCHAAIAPLALGAGVKFKVLEALACGVPVVGTPVGLEGVERNSLVVETSRAQFAEAIIQLFERAPDSS